nr:Bro-N domain-containing protein [uncultured Rhodoferax sp.]
MTNSLASSGGSAAALVFQSTEFDVIDQAGQPWLRGLQIGGALGYKRKDHAIWKLYESNKAEFTDSMTAVVKLPTAGGEQDTRIFSLRGAHLLAMFARTAIAALFRKWVLDILEHQTQSTQPMLVSNPAIDYTRISASQAQHLKELVQLIVESGKQNYAETWSRLHRKMKVNSYHELSPDQFDAAREYLMGKMDGQSIAVIAKKHFPQIAALPAPDNTLTKEQADTLRDMMIDASKAMPKDLQGPLMHEGCLKLKDHFKVDYCDIPQARFSEAVALVARHIAQWNQSKMPATTTMLQLMLVTTHNGQSTVEIMPADGLPNLLLESEGIFTPRQITDIVGHASMRMLREVCNIEIKSEAERMKKQVCTLNTADLAEVTKQGFVELSMRGTIQELHA